jgi:Spy/CpxP family protein refolding chaperone
MLRKTFVIAAAAWLLAAGAAFADQPPTADPIGAALLPPDLVMDHHQELGLSDAQMRAIQADVQSGQDRFAKLQPQLAAATAKLAELIKQSHVDQVKALAQLDALLDLEREAKHVQLGLMIQVKNELTLDQQTKARQLEAAGGK